MENLPWGSETLAHVHTVEVMRQTCGTTKFTMGINYCLFA
jgi:hypothetical protein